jgi:hypothetical protein
MQSKEENRKRKTKVDRKRSGYKVDRQFRTTSAGNEYQTKHKNHKHTHTHTHTHTHIHNLPTGQHEALVYRKLNSNSYESTKAQLVSNDKKLIDVVYP